MISLLKKKLITELPTGEIPVLTNDKSSLSQGVETPWFRGRKRVSPGNPWRSREEEWLYFF